MRLHLESRSHSAWGRVGPQEIVAKDTIVTGDEAGVKGPGAEQPPWQYEGGRQSSLDTPGSLCREGHSGRCARLQGVVGRSHS